MINRLLVANRGEIARRVFSTCRAMGIATVAVHSDPDEAAAHTREADIAVRLPGDAAGTTYLRSEALVRAALAARADAVHPGYGFLSENAGFAAAVLDAGLTWVGPPPTAIEAMASKIVAKRLMADAGVPVLRTLEPEAITEDDLPVLVKASAGGGGRGMRVVRDLGALPGQIAEARREAAGAFADDTVFCEPYLETGRHVEIQVLADQHGTVWALTERECSLQRRHQKIIEESPSPMVDEPLRDRLRDAAAAAARAVGYVGAGTVEFLALDDGRFFFLEMNTRLQVEHPITECVAGVDLVRLQLAIAEGAPLPSPDPPPPTGHAIEARLYAEDPAQDWRPQSGTLHLFAVPDVDARFAVPAGYGLRLDSGVASGDVVGIHYDALLAKVIAWAPRRDEAARRLATALANARIHGLVTNRELLARVLRHRAFLAGETDTAFFERHGVAALAEPLATEDAERLSALATALADAALDRRRARVLGGLPSGWRNVRSAPRRRRYLARHGEVTVDYQHTRNGVIAVGFDDVRVLEAYPDEVTLESSGVRRRFSVARYHEADHDLVCVDSALGPVSLRVVPRFPEPAARVATGSLRAPLPGTVVRLAVAEGDPVEPGQDLLWLEAMKMEHRVPASAAGVVTEMRVRVGQQVEFGEVLAVVGSDPPVDSEGDS